MVVGEDQEFVVIGGLTCPLSEGDGQAMLLNRWKEEPRSGHLSLKMTQNTDDRIHMVV